MQAPGQPGPRKRKPLSLAVHEAGHAVMAVHLGYRFLSVDVVAGGGTEGALHYGALPWWVRPGIRGLKMDAGRRAFLEAHVMVALAGGEAQEMYAGKPAASAVAGDLRKAMDCALIACGGDLKKAKALEALLGARVREVLRQASVRRQVQAVAAALLERERLTEDEVKRVCREAGKA